jgi:hypothetical protein
MDPGSGVVLFIIGPSASAEYFTGPDTIDVCVIAGGLMTPAGFVTCVTLVCSDKELFESNICPKAAVDPVVNSTIVPIAAILFLFIATSFLFFSLLRLLHSLGDNIFISAIAINMSVVES